MLSRFFFDRWIISWASAIISCSFSDAGRTGLIWVGVPPPPLTVSPYLPSALTFRVSAVRAAPRPGLHLQPTVAVVLINAEPRLRHNSLKITSANFRPASKFAAAISIDLVFTESVCFPQSAPFC